MLQFEDFLAFLSGFMRKSAFYFSGNFVSA